MKFARIAAWAILMFAIASLPASAAGKPLLIPHAPLEVPGGSGGWDWMLVDSHRHRLLASHPGTKTLAVLNFKTKILTQLPTGVEINGIAIDESDQKLFTAGGGQKVVIFSLVTLTKIGEIALNGPADDIALDKKTDRLYVCHDDSVEDWVVDAKTNALIGSVAIAGAPEYALYDSGADRLYQNIKPANVVQVINPATNKVETSWPTAPMTSPHGLAIDPVTHHIFSAGQGKLVVLDQNSGKVISSVDIAPGYVDQIEFDAGKGRIYCACGDAGVISVVQETNKGATLLGTVPTHKKSHTLAIDPENHSVWISYSDAAKSFLQQFTVPEQTGLIVRTPSARA